ncbi:MAG: nucleotidyltransferase domain-containing protein [Endomicrobia bacterium]|nr:nucleotidyltransferase domain-containing protein [Endomicrobiia bacterium]MCL2506251.1 nucleotidyltransferase domain-containing protein [Endomicrobiia bacterium]
MSLAIEDRHLKIINDILNEHLKPANAVVYVFGSRTNGKSGKYSDLDLAVDYSGQKLPFEIYTNLVNLFENSALPYKVDIVDLNDISEQFKNNIKDTLIKL